MPIKSINGEPIAIGAKDAVTDAHLNRDGGMFSSVFEALTPTWSQTGHINPNNGEVASNTTFSHTDYIECDNCLYVAVWVNFNAAAAGIAFYDKNKKYVSGHGFNFAASDTADIDLLRAFEVPNGATYFRTTTKDQASRTVRYEIYKAFVPTSESLTSLKLDTVVPNVLYRQLDVTWHDNQGHIQSSDGTVSENTAFSYCDYVECPEYEAVGIWVSFIAPAAGIAFYDANHNFISSVPFSFSTSEAGTGTIADFHIVTVPDNAAYFRTCIRPDKPATFNLATNSNKTLYGIRSVESIIGTSGGRRYTCLKDGTGDFDNIVTAIQTACDTMDNTLYIGSGVWDIIEDYGGQSAVEALISSSNRGLYLKNRVHVICSSDALIKCEYEGDNATTHAWLVAFNAGDYGFTLENARIHTKNCRYTIHDEMDRHVPHYDNIYKNCDFVHDNDYNDGGGMQVIGGGLGKDGRIVIDGCIFENPVYSEQSGTHAIVSYHNTWYEAGGRSTIEITDCYFVGNSTARVSYFGNSTDMTKAIIANNSMGSAPFLSRETTSQTSVATDIVNVELFAWNNEVRS